jgi:hypothetical protein
LVALHRARHSLSLLCLQPRQDMHWQLLKQ